jgi:hypothetical protein
MAEVIRKYCINYFKMPLSKGIFFVLCFFFVTNSRAQFFDSIRVDLRRKPSIDFRLDSRTSFISTQPARISGIKIGLVFNKKVRVGIGYNWLNSNISKQSNVVDVSGAAVNVVSKLHLNYVSPYFEYSYYISDKLELSIPILIGIGRAYYSSVTSVTLLQSNQLGSGLLVMYEPYSIGIYKVTPWFGLGFGIGYRLVLVGNKTINENINSPIYVVKAKLYASELLKFFKY